MTITDMPNAPTNRSRVTPALNPQGVLTRGTELLTAKDIIRTVETLNGQDDNGV